MNGLNSQQYYDVNNNFCHRFELVSMNSFSNSILDSFYFGCELTSVTGKEKIQYRMEEKNESFVAKMLKMCEKRHVLIMFRPDFGYRLMLQLSGNLDADGRLYS